MTYPVSQSINSIGSGNTSTSPFLNIFATRNPTVNDIQFPVGKRWINTVTIDEFILLGFISTSGVVQANWQSIQSTVNTETLTGNSGGAVPATANNINVKGDGTSITIAGNPGTSTLTASLVAPVTVPNGGTGVTTITGVITGNGTSAFTGSAVTQYDVLVGAAANAISSVGPGSSGQPLLSGGSGANPAYGDLTVPHGGTGATTLTGVITGNGTSAFTASAITQHDVLVAGASNAITSVSPSTAGFVLTSNGISADPSFKLPTGISAINVQTFTNSNTYNPTANCLYAYVQLCGGGGGGGGAATTSGSDRSAAAGGSGGGYAAATIYSPTTQTVTIGAAGAAGAAGNNAGGNGGTTSFGSVFSATGGGGGAGGASVTDPNSTLNTSNLSPGAGSGGDVNVTGGIGNNLFILGSVVSCSGSGGSSYFGPGGYASLAGTTFASGGKVGYAYGAGGSGGCTASASQTTGGAGIAGVCIITEYIA